MKYYLNELSTRNIASNIDTAHKWLSTFFEICDQSSIRVQNTVSVVSTLKFSAIHFQEDTSFTNWIKTLKDADYRRRILSMITKDQIKIDYPYYYFEQVACQGLGIAYENDSISISYGTEHWDNHELYITREQFDKNENVEITSLNVKHVASIPHLDIHLPVRRFKHNPKHDRVRPIANKTEKVSILECSNEEAYKLLCSAIGEKTASDKQLFYFDKKIGKYIIFYRHTDKEYHGYHTDNENDVPVLVRSKLKEMID